MKECLFLSCGRVSSLALPLLATLLSTSLHGSRLDDRAYNITTSPGTLHADWMSWVPDDVYLSEMSLPGTHDSIAYTIPAILVPPTQTQSLNVTSQLNAGIRVFDVRFSYQNDSFWLYHGIVNLGLDFEDVLRDCNDFLDVHSTETIIVRISQSGTPEPGTIVANTNTASHVDAFFLYRDGSEGGRIWIPSGFDPRPKLGEVRGKIVISTPWDYSDCSDCGLDEDQFNAGLNYGADYDVPNYVANVVSDIEAKEAEIATQLDKIDAGQRDAFYTCSLNVTGLIFPWTGADGDNILLLGGKWDGLNTTMLDYLLAGRQSRTTGMVMMDFPGSSVIGAIIGHNMKYATDLTKLGPDFTSILLDVNYGTSDRGKWSSGDTESCTVAEDLLTYLYTVMPGQNWQVLVGKSKLDVSYWHNGLIAQTPSTIDDSVRLVWNATSFSSQYSDSELANYLDLGRLKSLSGNETDRAQATWDMLNAQFPLARWNVLVKKDNFSCDPWSHSDLSSVATYFKSSQYSDDGNDYVTVAWAGVPANLPPVVSVVGAPYVFGEGQPLILDASSTYDPDGDALTYLWDFNSDGVFDKVQTTPVWNTGDMVQLKEGNYTGTLLVTEDNYEITTTFNYTITNVPPVVNAGGNEAVFLGLPFSRMVTITDPLDDSWTARVNYGFSQWFDLTVNPDGTFLIEGTFPMASTNTVTVEVSDGTDLTTVQFIVYVIDVGSPCFQSFACLDSDPEEGEAVQFAGLLFDPAWTSTDGVTIDWGDGTPPREIRGTFVNDGNGRWSFTAGHIFAENSGDPGYNIVLSDARGTLKDFATRQTIANVPPSFPGVLAPITTGEGLPVGGIIGFADPGADTWTLFVKYGDGTTNSQTLTQRNFLLANVYQEVGIYNLQLVIQDDEGGVGYAATKVTVTNVEPVIESLALEQQVISEGDTAVVTGVVRSQGRLEPGVEVMIDWGDGRPPTLAALAPTMPPDPRSRQWSASHRYWDNSGATATPPNTYRITATVIDMDGTSSSSGSILVGVMNVSPTINAAGQAWAPEGLLLATYGSFSDPGRDTWTGQVDYGDGSGVQPLSILGTTYALKHAYTTNGLYTAQLTVTDDDGASHSVNRLILVGPPSLRIRLIGGLRVWWRDHEADFRLQHKPRLADGPWGPIDPGLVTNNNGTNTFMIPAGQEESIFRLVWP